MSIRKPHLSVHRPPRQTRRQRLRGQRQTSPDTRRRDRRVRHLFPHVVQRIPRHQQQTYPSGPRSTFRRDGSPQRLGILLHTVAGGDQTLRQDTVRTDPEERGLSVRVS